MKRVETGKDTVSEARKGYFVAALRELRQRTQRTQDDSAKMFELPEIAQHASRLDPDFEPCSRLERALTWLGVEVDKNPEAVRERERGYLGKRGGASRIMQELVETGEAEEAPIAPVLLLEPGADYGNSPNEDGKLYSLPEPVLETVG